MEPPEFFVAITSILAIFVGLPWMVFHYVTKWKQAPKITSEDEQLLDEMYNLARRLEDRLQTVERIVAADNPEFRPRLDIERGRGTLGQPGYQIDRRN